VDQQGGFLEQQRSRKNQEVTPWSKARKGISKGKPEMARRTARWNLRNVYLKGAANWAGGGLQRLEKPNENASHENISAGLKPWGEGKTAEGRRRPTEGRQNSEKRRQSKQEKETSKGAKRLKNGEST